MITMDLKQQILHYYRVDELSLREIARRTGADRKTVTRLINAYEAAIKADPDMGIDEFLATKPKYTAREYEPRVMRDVVAKEIDRCLKENDGRLGNGMRRQCIKNTDIHRQLMEKGLTVSYSGVCKYIRKKKNERASKGEDVYLRIHREPGIECEFDWGEVKLFLDGIPTTLMMAVFCFPYSKGRMAYLFHRQDTLAYMESHRDFFRDCAGVPHVMVYDNMRVAVVFDEKDKKPTTALMRLSTYYKFEWRFCNARSGWEKGNVERSVDYVRGRAFTSRVDFDDIAYEEVVDAATLISSNGVKTFTADHFKVALQTMKSKNEPFREEQKTDEFIEIETGSEDILSQLENVMENGTKLPE